LFAVAALILGLALAEPEPMAPSLSADLDGDGSAETVTAAPARGAVRLEVRDAPRKKKLAAKAPAPAEDVVRVSLTSAPLGSTGALLEVLASTDASECVSVWRYHDAALTRIPIHDVSGRPLSDCEAPGVWSHRWERESPDAPSAWLRERTESVERGTLRRKEVFIFAGFSLDADPKRSAAEIDGLPIPSWYASRLYTRPGLEALSRRYDLATFRSQPRLSILTDRDRGVFTLRFQTPGGEIVTPVESFASVPSEHTASLVARTGETTFRTTVRLGGDGSVPIEVRVEGLRRDLDVSYAPAAAWHGRVREVFASAAEEIASQYLPGSWSGPQGSTIPIQVEGVPQYSVRMDKALFTMDMDHAPPAVDFALVPADGSSRVWGVVLRGSNSFQRIPMACGADGSAHACRPDGASETLRRIGARVNVN
jgi:hypothetical protein